MQYVQIINEDIIGPPRALPVTFANISGFNHLDDKTLVEFGWYPVIDEPPVSEGEWIPDTLIYNDSFKAVIQTYREVEQAVEDLETLRGEVVAAINACYKAALAPIAAEYPEEERVGWPLQQAESERYLQWVAEGENGPPPPTPVLDNLLIGRNADGGNETIVELATRIRNNAVALIASQVFTGHRHRLEKKALTAKTREELLAIDPEAVFSPQSTTN